MMKQTISLYNSNNGEYLIGLWNTGDFRIYEVSTHKLYSIKGLPFFSTTSSRGVKNVALVRPFLSDDGNMIMVKVLQNDENINSEGKHLETNCIYEDLNI